MRTSIADFSFGSPLAVRSQRGQEKPGGEEVRQRAVGLESPKDAAVLDRVEVGKKSGGVGVRAAPETGGVHPFLELVEPALPSLRLLAEREHENEGGTAGFGRSLTHHGLCRHEFTPPPSAYPRRASRASRKTMRPRTRITANLAPKAPGPE